VHDFSRRCIRALLAVQLVALGTTPKLFEAVVCTQKAPTIKVNFSRLAGITELLQEFRPVCLLTFGVGVKAIVAAFTFREAYLARLILAIS